MAFNGLGSVPSHMCSALEVSRHCNKSVNDSTATLSTERRPKHHHVLQIRGAHLHDPFRRSKVGWHGCGRHPKAVAITNIIKPEQEEDAILDFEYPLRRYESEDRFAFERCGKPRLTSKVQRLLRSRTAAY